MKSGRRRRKFLMVLPFAILFMACVSVGCVSGATPPEEAWNMTFGGPDRDVARSVQQTADGGYILTGGTYSFETGRSDARIVKTDSVGNELWNKTFGGANHDWAISVQQTVDGGYILAGGTDSYGAGRSDAWLIKTDSAGNEQWNMTFGGPDWDRASSAQQTADGGYIVAGETESYVVDTADAWLLKTDSSGTALWNMTFGGTDLDGANAVQQTADGGYIIAGSTESYDASDRDF